LWKSLGTLSNPNAVSQVSVLARSTVGGVIAKGGERAVQRVFNMHAAVFLVWIAGCLACASRVVVGEVSLYALVKRACVLRPKKYSQVLERFARAVGEKQKVTLLRSEQCAVPFTFHLRSPVIVLPFDVGRWPAGRLRAVLAHEICHVKRKDHFTQLIARTVCSIFWFNPFVWLGYRSLYLEQESACDGMAVVAGVEQAVYARCILDFVRVMVRRSSSAGLRLARGSRRTLEKRIRSVLDFKPFGGAGVAQFSNGVPRRLLRALVVLTSVFFFLGSISEKVELAAPPVSGKMKSPATGRSFYVPVRHEELYGTWLNPDYSGIVGGNCQKIVFDDWGYSYDYRSIADRNSLNKWTSTIVDKRTDADGNIWYWEFEQCPGFYSVLQLIRISDGGKTLEWVFDYNSFPEQTDLNPINITYRVYYRGK
jgi:beta-lactamase regulating signal transducer with metallopeptidase domain